MPSANLPVNGTSPNASESAGAWGYTQSETVEEFALLYAELMNAVRSLPLLAGFCYTQFTDPYQEANGLLYANRTPKFHIDEIRMATRGAQVELTLRQHLMDAQRNRIGFL